MLPKSVELVAANPGFRATTLAVMRITQPKLLTSATREQTHRPSSSCETALIPDYTSRHTAAISPVPQFYTTSTQAVSMWITPRREDDTSHTPEQLRYELLQSHGAGVKPNLAGCGTHFRDQLDFPYFFQYFEFKSQQSPVCRTRQSVHPRFTRDP